MFNNKAEAKQRFSLRKLTVGVVSVLLGLTFLTYNGENVHADTNAPSAQPKTEEVSPSSSKNDVTEKSASVLTNANKEKAPVKATNLENKNAANEVEGKSSSSQVAGKISATQDVNKAKDKINKASQQGKTGDNEDSAVQNRTGIYIGEKAYQEGKKIIAKEAEEDAKRLTAEAEANYAKLPPDQKKNPASYEVFLNKPIPKDMVAKYFGLNKPDISDAQLAKLGLTKDTFFVHDASGKTEKVKVGKTDLIILSWDGRQKFQFEVPAIHNADGFIHFFDTDANMDAETIAKGYYIGDSFEIFESGPITEGKHIYININHPLDDKDAARAIINAQSYAYATGSHWITDFDNTKAGNYEGHFEAFYKNGVGILTGVPITVVDLKGATITGTLGKDIQNKLKDVEQHVDKYVTGQPKNSHFGKFNAPDITKATTKEDPAVGTVTVTYPDGNTGIAKIYFIINSPITYKDIAVPETRTVKFGYYKNGTGNPNDWVTLAPDVVETKNLIYKASVGPDGVPHFISWEPNQDATLAAVPWAKIAGWVPRFSVLGPHSSRDYAAIPEALIDFKKNTGIVNTTEIIYCTYIKENTKDVDTGETRSFTRRVHFGYYDENHKWNELTQPEIEVLSFHHHILVNQYGDQVKDDGYKPVTTQTFEAVPWKVIEGWIKAKTTKNAAESYTVLLDDVTNKPQNQLVLDVYAPYIKVSQPTSPVQPTKPTSPTQPTNQPSQPTSQPSQPTTIPPKPPVNPTKPVEPAKPNQPSNVYPKPVKTIRPAKPQSSNVKPKPVKPAKARTTKPITQNGKKKDHHYGYYVPKAASSKSYSGVSNASALKACNKVLPHTGSKGNGIIAAIGAAFAAVAGFFGLAGRKRRKF